MQTDSYTESMEKNYIDKLAYILIKDRKVLTTRSIGKDTWYIPGGKREGDETDVQALAREVEEELSVRINPERLSTTARLRLKRTENPRERLFA